MSCIFNVSFFPLATRKLSHIYSLSLPCVLLDTSVALSCMYLFPILLSFFFFLVDCLIISSKCATLCNIITKHFHQRRKNPCAPSSSLHTPTGQHCSHLLSDVALLFPGIVYKWNHATMWSSVFGFSH